MFACRGSRRNDTALKTIDRNLWRKSSERGRGREGRGNEARRGERGRNFRRGKEGKKKGISGILCITEAY